MVEAGHIGLGEVVGHTRQNVGELGFEVAHSHLRCVGSVKSSNLHVSQMWFFMLSDILLSRTCFLGTVPARFSRSSSALFIHAFHFLILVALHGLNKDGVAVDFHHNHDVLVATSRMRRELPCLIREHGFAYHVCFGVINK